MRPIVKMFSSKGTWFCICATLLSLQSGKTCVLLNDSQLLLSFSSVVNVYSLILGWFFLFVFKGLFLFERLIYREKETQAGCVL